MKKGKRFLSTVMTLALLVFVGGGMFIGFVIGDYILDASVGARANDVILCRVVLPVAGGFLFLALGSFAVERIEDKLSKSSQDK